MDGNNYLEAYFCVESKGLSCKWNIATDVRVRVRVTI
jgi:hypothetical protein